MRFGRLKKVPKRSSRQMNPEIPGGGPLPLKNFQAGISLLEIALAMMILAVLSVGVSSLIKTAVETQMARRTDVTMQSIGLNFADDIRMDVRTADTVSVSSDGKMLTLAASAGNIIYELNSSQQMTRRDTATNSTKIYNDPAQFNTPRFNVVCPTTCFTALRFNSDATPVPREVRVNAIQIQPQTTSNSGNIIDQAFGPANFTIKAFTFSILSATEFQ